MHKRYPSRQYYQDEQIQKASAAYHLSSMFILPVPCCTQQVTVDWRQYSWEDVRTREERHLPGVPEPSYLEWGESFWIRLDYLTWGRFISPSYDAVLNTLLVSRTLLCPSTPTYILSCHWTWIASPPRRSRFSLSAYGLIVFFSLADCMFPPHIDTNILVLLPG